MKAVPVELREDREREGGRRGREGGRRDMEERGERSMFHHLREGIMCDMMVLYWKHGLKGERERE